MIISSQILPTGFYIEGFHNERYTISIRLLYEIDKDFTLRRTNKLYYKIDEDPSFYQTHVFSLYFSASVIFPDKTYLYVYYDISFANIDDYNFYKKIDKELNNLKNNFAKYVYLIMHDVDRNIYYQRRLQYYGKYIRIKNMRAFHEDLIYIGNKYKEAYRVGKNDPNVDSFMHTQPFTNYIEDNEIKLSLLLPQPDLRYRFKRGPLHIPSLKDVKNLKAFFVMGPVDLSCILGDMSSRYILITSDIIVDGKRIDEDFYKGIRISNRVTSKDFSTSLVSLQYNAYDKVIITKSDDEYVINLFGIGTETITRREGGLIIFFYEQSELIVFDKVYKVSGAVKIQCG